MFGQMALGILIGLICPLLILFGIYLYNYSNYEVVDYLVTSFETGLLAKKLSLGAILNLAVFMLFINIRKELIARGVFIATIIVGAFIVYIKYLV
jgi:hypothetical protein